MSSIPSAEEPDTHIWSAAFVSWLISQCGNPDGIELSQTHVAIWMSATSKSITFSNKTKQVLPGDLIFIANREEDVELLKSGKFVPASILGVVYTIKGEKLQYIAGNIDDAVRLQEDVLSDARIVGFARVGNSQKDAVARPTSTRNVTPH